MEEQKEQKEQKEQVLENNCFYEVKVNNLDRERAFLEWENYVREMKGKGVTLEMDFMLNGVYSGEKKEEVVGFIIALIAEDIEFEFEVIIKDALEL